MYEYQYVVYTLFIPTAAVLAAVMGAIAAQQDRLSERFFRRALGALACF
jgi:hypothetical protein